ncbi:MAG: TolC family protein [Planctomycetes bacterium]|nr:TolC family protein [Planctomycetota bacterium]
MNRTKSVQGLWLVFCCAGLGVLLMGLWGCEATRATLPHLDRPDVGPEKRESSSETVTFSSSAIQPMYKEQLAVDLPTIGKVAIARNLDIQLARQRVAAYEGRVQSVLGTLFPAFSPAVLFEHMDGTVRATQGNLLSASFNSFQPLIAVQWLLNPGKVYYDMVAARKRLLASQYEERALALETLHKATNQYYELALGQARVASAIQALAEAHELFRITQSRARAGTGLTADEIRGQAEVAGRQQDLILALKSFYDASVALSVTLNLDSTATLIPSAEKLPKTTLVKEDLPIEDLLALAVEHRDDLKSVRILIAAASAERSSTKWGGVGPQIQSGYQGGGIMSNSNNIGSPPKDQSSGLVSQQRFTASATWKFGLSTFGELKSSKAAEKQAYIQADRKLAAIRAEVVNASQDSKAQSEIILKAHQQVASAEEALRLTKVNLEAGTMTTLDILHAESAAAQARLRYCDAVVRYNQAQVNLLASIGLLDEKCLAPETTATKAEVKLEGQHNP